MIVGKGIEALEANWFEPHSNDLFSLGTRTCKYHHTPVSRWGACCGNDRGPCPLSTPVWRLQIETIAYRYRRVDLVA